MNDGTKSVLTGLLGLVAGVALTVFGVSEINKRVITSAENIGELKEKIRNDEENLELIRKRAETTEKEVIALQEKLQSTLDSVEAERGRLTDTSEKISLLLSDVSDLSEDDATKQLKLLSALAKDLGEDNAGAKLLFLEQSVRGIEETLSDLDKSAMKLNYFSAVDIDGFTELGLISGYVKGDGQHDLSKIVPPDAKGVLLKAMVNGGGSADTSGSVVCSDENGEYANTVAHYYQNGVNQYGKHWGGGVIFCPFVKGSKTVKYRTLSNKVKGADKLVIGITTPIAWY